MYVDFETQKGTIKDSGYLWRDVIAKGELEYDETLGRGWAVGLQAVISLSY